MVFDPDEADESRDDRDELDDRDVGEGDGVAGRPGPVPEELAVLPPGSMLGELLEQLDATTVRGYDTVELLKACERQLNYQHALFYGALLETGLRAAGSADTVVRCEEPGEFGCEEARAALVWSRRRASAGYELAFDLFCRLPELGQAMKRGRLDLARAKAFITWTEGLTDTQAGQVCHELLPDAPSLMVGELISEIQRACLAVDPDYAANKYKAAVKKRVVRGWMNPDGTGSIGGYQQPVDRVIAASERINTLARQCKRAGDRRKIDLIRSDLYLRMLDGTFTAMDDAQIVDYVLANPLVPAGDDESNGDDTDSGDGGHDADGGGGADSSGEPEPAEGDGQTQPADDDEQAAHDETADHDDQAQQSGDRGQPDPARQPQEPGRSAGAAASRGWSVAELRAQLPMLLGDNDAPGEVPGWGLVPAWLARHLVGSMHSAQWRWVVCDAGGRAIDGGLLTGRPRTRDGRAHRDARRGGIVELAISESDLHRLAGDADRPGQWAPVIAEIARRHTERAHPDGRHGGEWSDRDVDAADAHRRTPGAALRRWLNLRDRQCTHPCCRAPAASADIDHRVGWADGGRTMGTNLGPGCRHDHRLKDDGGWGVDQSTAGVTVWTSPLGHSYASRPPPVIPRRITPRPRVPDDEDCPADGRPAWKTCTCVLGPCPHIEPEPQADEGDSQTDGGARRVYDPEGEDAAARRRRTKGWFDSLQADRHGIYDDGTPPF